MSCPLPGPEICPSPIRVQTPTAAIDVIRILRTLIPSLLDRERLQNLQAQRIEPTQSPSSVSRTEDLSSGKAELVAEICKRERFFLLAGTLVGVLVPTRLAVTKPIGAYAFAHNGRLRRKFVETGRVAQV